LPNPDIHEVIAKELDMEPSKVFFGINLVRVKLMKLPKLDYPKRKLAVTPDQLMAVESLYLPYLPLPPIGIHKIISKQLRMDEWRVHVAIGLLRKARNMPRWNEDRDDLPPAMKESLDAKAKEDAAAEKAAAKEAKADDAEKPAKAKKETASKEPKDKEASPKKTSAKSAAKEDA
jgi:hypothetical protein